MNVNEHHVEEVDARRICTCCLREWSQLQRSRRRCPGMPWYTYGQAPDHLSTYTQLKKMRLKPLDRKKPDGCIITAYHDIVYLYDMRQALPRRSETERQRTARLATWPRIQKKYKCEHCGYIPKSLADIQYEMHHAGLCLRCLDMLEWQNHLARIENDRRSACEWAYNLLHNPGWAVIDTETVSLDGVVCEIGVIAPDGTILFESLVNPEQEVSPAARAKHGISDEELAAAPTLPQVWTQLQEVLQDCTILVAYNSAFDSARLEQSARRYHLPPLTQEWHCAMEAYSQYCGNWSEHHRSYRWVSLNGSHRAVGDATAALECIREMATVYEKEYAPLELAVEGEATEHKKSPILSQLSEENHA